MGPATKTVQLDVRMYSIPRGAALAPVTLHFGEGTTSTSWQREFVVTQKLEGLPDLGAIASISIVASNLWAAQAPQTGLFVGSDPGFRGSSAFAPLGLCSFRVFGIDPSNNCQFLFPAVHLIKKDLIQKRPGCAIGGPELLSHRRCWPLKEAAREVVGKHGVVTAGDETSSKEDRAAEQSRDESA